MMTISSKATVATLQKICNNKNITKNKLTRQNNNPTKLVINIMKMATQARRGQKKKSRAIKIENHKTKRRTSCNHSRTDRKSVNRRAIARAIGKR